MKLFTIILMTLIMSAFGGEMTNYRNSIGPKAAIAAKDIYDGQLVMPNVLDNGAGLATVFLEGSYDVHGRLQEPYNSRAKAVAFLLATEKKWTEKLHQRSIYYKVISSQIVLDSNSNPVLLLITYN